MKQNNNHEEKMIAPIIITIILVGYYMAIACVWMFLPEVPLIVKLLLALIPLALAGVAAAMLWERICEIRSGEEDDLSQY